MVAIRGGRALFEATTDTSELETLLNKAARDNLDLSPVMAVIAEDLVTAVSDEYETAGRGRWPPLAESTIRARRMNGIGAEILKDTGRAAASTQPSSGPDFAEASTDVSYMVFHASQAPRAKIPYRNPFDLPESVFDDAAQTLLDAIRI